MCAPKTKIEREVDRLHRQLPALSERQINWALEMTQMEDAKKYRGRNCDIKVFVIATKKGEWQVLRTYYLYAYYRYGKLSDYEITEVMQEWYNWGEYVFYSRNRVMGYCNDAWTYAAMSIKRGVMGGYILDDPRQLGYDGHLIVSLTKQFKYMDTSHVDIRRAFRAKNYDPYAEVIVNKCPSLLDWCYNTQLNRHTYQMSMPNKEHIDIVKVALRHGYDVSQTDWKDHVAMLKAEGKDIHNPHYICPDNLAEEHQKLLERIERRRENERLAAMARQILRDKKAREEYPKARNRFFGVLIAGQGIEIKCLQSVQEFMDEGEEMHHCVFGNAYYDMQKHPNSLILSAKKDGQRVETIEVDLRDYSIVQSRGKHNSATEYHDTIIQLMNDNMGMIRQADRRKAV